MQRTFQGLIDEMLYPMVAAAESSAKPSEIECAVIIFFEEFRNPLLRYALSFGISVHDAEEVTQEVFLSLFRHLQAQKSRKNLRGWLFRVTHNLALKQRYENQRCIDRCGNAAVETQLDASPNPEQHFSIVQRRCLLLAVVANLPEDDRRCLYLRAEGLCYREIAAVLGISLGSVSNSLARSLARLTRAEER